jgi:Protein of unknown function (DUF3551)
MRTTIWALALGCATMMIGVHPAAARDYPFCISGCTFGSGLGDCSFSSYQQCEATASGLTATCAPNPYYNASASMRNTPVRMSKRKL